MARVVIGPEESRRLAWQSAHSQPQFRREDHRRSYRPQDLDTTGAGDDNLHVACACFQAYVDKDRSAIEQLIAEDFHFTSPLDNRIDRDTYFERCWPSARTARGFDFVHLAADGDRVFVTYEAEHASGKRFRNTEVMTIRNGQICEVEVYFGWNVPHDAPKGSFRNKQ